MGCNKVFLLFSCAIQCTLGLQVANISLCPQLAARPTPPIAAYDLRPDDFSMIMALGDRFGHLHLLSSFQNCTFFNMSSTNYKCVSWFWRRRHTRSIS
jgi:hypothetical protein